jgi:DNA-binding MarR family transcriptional regulator
MYNTYVNDTPSVRLGLFSLLHAAEAAQAHVESRLAVLGLSLPKLAALHQLAAAGDSLPLGQLAERLSCVKSNITQLIDRLEADGFVTRELDPTDRRSRLAVMTSAGRKAYEQGMRIQQQSEQEIFATLTDEEGRQLAALISKVQQQSQ